MKRLFPLLAALVACLSAEAQSNIRFGSFWFDTFYLNPAAIDELLPLWKVGLGTRQQWMKFPGAPRTYAATTAYYNDAMKSQIGLRVVADRIGYTQSIDASLAYAYSVDMNGARLNLGLAFRAQNLVYDWAQAFTGNTLSDPATYQNLQAQLKYNTDAGLELSWQQHGRGKWLFGLASQNLLSLFMPEQDPFSNANFLYGRFRTNNRETYYYDEEKNRFDFSVAALLVHTKLYDAPHVLQTEWNANVHFNLGQYVLSTGLLYRLQSEAGLIFGVDYGNHISGAIVYEYPFEFAQTKNIHPLGTIEVMLTFRFKTDHSPCGQRYGKPCTEEFKPNTRCLDCPAAQKQRKRGTAPGL
jgi:type IX secretion system PorP/SprF family membrane protein